MHYISFKDHVNIFQPDVFLLTANETNRNKIAQQSTAHCAQCSGAAVDVRDPNFCSMIIHALSGSLVEPSIRISLWGFQL